LKVSPISPAAPEKRFLFLSLKFKIRMNSEKFPFASIYQILSGAAGENFKM
jgi:hypothetical protein